MEGLLYMLENKEGNSVGDDKMIINKEIKIKAMFSQVEINEND